MRRAALVTVTLVTVAPVTIVPVTVVLVTTATTTDAQTGTRTGTQIGGAGGEAPDPYPTCTAQTVAVALSPADSTVYRLAGRLCLRDNADRGVKTVKLMMSGFTYDHNYFNFGYAPDRYSYVHAATNRGYSTFNIDRLGVGLSDRPPADRLTTQTHAYVTEQLVRKLRAGAIGGKAFTTVVGIGHSLGAGILQRLAATVTDPAGVPDYLILSGWLHQTPIVSSTFSAALHDASADPILAPSNPPTGYLTTRAGARATLFYNLSAADSTVVSLDESLKQTGTRAEQRSLVADRATTLTRGIQVPVLLSVGQNDPLHCDTARGLPCATEADILARESAYYGPRACLSAYIAAGAGHSVNLHVSSRASYDHHHTWLDNYLVYKVRSRDADGCLRAPWAQRAE